MNMPRLIILLMLLVQLIVTGILTETRAFPAVMAIAAIILYLRPFRMQFSQRQQVYLFLAVTALFAAKMRMFPLEITGRFSPFPGYYDLNHALTQLLIVVQMLLLGIHSFTARKENRLFSVHYAVPLMGIASLALIGDFVSRSLFYRITSMTSAGIFSVLFALHIALATGGINRHKGAFLKYALSLLVLTASIASGITLSLFAAPNVAKLDEFLFRYFQPNINTGSTGLSDQTTLQSITALHKRNNEKVAIRVFSDSSPEYLRAHVRDSLKGRVWESTSPLKPLRPTSPPPIFKNVVGENQFFQLRQDDGIFGQLFKVWSADYQRDLLFTTLNTACVAASPTLIKTDAHLHCAVEGLPRSRPYLLVDGAVSAGDAPDDATWKQCLQVPESLSEAARQACMKVTEQQHTAADKIRAVTHYFRSNYTYQYGIQIPSRQDPLSYFLTERPPAHCEYFASGAVIMLRLAGVPARYVTGFVVTEKNTSGGYWIARNRDAHAWAEAWDDQRGWVTVEATPPDGLPHSEPTSAFAAFRDRLKFKLAQILALIRENGINAIGELLHQLIIALFMTLPGRVLSGMLLLGTAAYGLRNYRPHWRKQQHGPEEEAFLRLLARADREAAQRGFVRGKSETLNNFGNRMLAANQEQADHKALGNWYITCAALRCNGTSVGNANTILQEQLHQTLNTPT